MENDKKKFTVFESEEEKLRFKEKIDDRLKTVAEENSYDIEVTDNSVTRVDKTTGESMTISAFED